MTANSELPESIANEEQLNDLLTRPSKQLVRSLGELSGNLLVLGAGGKMGPTLAVRARRALSEARNDSRVIAISRFSDAASRQWLHRHAVETVSADLLDRTAVAQLPDASHVIYLVGTKFGTSRDPSHTWAINTLVPGNVMERYPEARFVALSTGNVYPLSPVTQGGSVETDPVGPEGEYACTAVGRERIFDYYSRRNGTPVVIVRLNYACDLRYGVLTDLARKIRGRETIDLTQGHFNCIWQGDANDLALRSIALADSPPRVLNLTGTEVLSVHQVAIKLGRWMDRPVTMTGLEADHALLSNAAECARVVGQPETPIDTMIRWTSRWVIGNRRLLNKPTHFEVRDGNF